MVVKKKSLDKKIKKDEKKKSKVVEEDFSKGVSLDDAFGDDEDVEYAPAKPQKVKKKDEDEEKDEEDDRAVSSIEDKVEELGVRKNIKASKSVDKLKKGDRIIVDGNILEVDAQYVLIDHGTTKEMTIELFDAKTDKDYQLRYFDDQFETTLEFYELQDIIYIKKAFSKVEW